MSRKIFYIVFVILLFWQCKEVYNPPVVSMPSSFLVVDGFISSTDTTIITLSRTTNIADTTTIKYEPGAFVRVEGDNNENHVLYENSTGIYSGIFNLTAGNKYRLYIKTTDGKEYTSDFMPVRYTPAIDSISWLRDNGNVQVYVNTHSNQSDTGYYLWNYTETWEFHSAFVSSLMYYFDPISGSPVGIGLRSQASKDSMYYCWKTQNSTNIILGSSEQLTRDRIFQPIRLINENAEELSVLYFIKVRQYSISKDAYLFYQKLKKNTEQLGTIFDPQPSELGGNIHCLSNPNEMVVGYVDISQKQEKNIFISNAEVTPWALPVTCGLFTVENTPDGINAYAGYTPVGPVEYRGFAITKFSVSTDSCVDCRLRGTHTKPSFWP